MANQNMQIQVQGDFAAAAAAMTPGPAGSPLVAIGDKPSGLTPSAKRPVEPSTIQVAAGATTVMSTADLSQAFTNVNTQQMKGEKWMVDIAKVVGYNGELLNACLLYTSPSPRDGLLSRMPSSA